MAILYWLSFFIFIGIVGLVAKRIAQQSLTEWLITSFMLFVGCIIPVGFALSALDLISSTFSWILGNFIAIALQYVCWSYLLPRQATYAVRGILANRLDTFKLWIRELSPYLRFVFFIMFGTVIVLGITNLIMIIGTPPNEWDSMTGHLNRAIRYIQRGTMAHFGGTNWSMDTYPKSPTTIHIYTYLISGGIENAMKAIHFLSFWVTVAAVFGIAQRIGRNLSASFFCALAYSMFLDFLVQAIFTETDIVLTAYLSCLLYFLFTYFNSRDNRYLYLAGFAIGVALGHKVTFVFLVPSVFVLMIYTVFIAPNFKVFLDRVLRLSIAVAVSLMIYTFPTGYIRNIQVFGHPIGPPTALKHQSIERAGSLANLVKQGTRNVIRYSIDFCNLDGIRNAQWGYDLNQFIRRPLVVMEDRLKLRLDEEEDFTITPFRFNKRFESYNALPYWGVFGFALILPIVLLVFFRVFRSRVHWFLAVALILHFLAVSYTAAYDAFKGRYFIETGLFGVLFLLLLFSHHRLTILKPRRRIWRGYIALIVVLACVSAVMAVFLNMRNLPFGAYGMESALTMDRIALQTFARPDITKAYERFDSIVPQHATVALGTVNSDFEYPLYGSKLTRRLISINPFEQGLQPIPKEADYLFYARSVINDTSRIRALPTDIRLGSDTTMTNLIEKGEDYYLRKLK
jgi:4-amino-4-deoxy-L-arabinose transferase-like glycosyltransferase